MKADVLKFMKEYERATNTHDFGNVAPLLHPRAVYFFSEGTYAGKSNICVAFEKTWRAIRDEKYTIRDVSVLSESEKVAVVTYKFSWSGKRNGKKISGKGRGTNTLEKSANGWQMKGEHLSV